MHIKVLMYRNVSLNHKDKLQPYLIQLRSMAEKMPGYLKGETLTNTDDTSKTVVISSWQTVEDWENWLNSHTRRTIQQEIDRILTEPTYYQVYFAQD